MFAAHPAKPLPHHPVITATPGTVLLILLRSTTAIVISFPFSAHIPNLESSHVSYDLLGALDHRRSADLRRPKTGNRPRSVSLQVRPFIEYPHEIAR